MSPEVGEDGELDPDLRQLARDLSKLLATLHHLAREEAGNGLADRLEAHLGRDPRGLPVVSEALPPYQLVDVQVALDVWGTKRGRSIEVVGVSGDQRRFQPLSELLARSSSGVDIGPVDYVDLADSPDTTRSCVHFGLFLLSDGDRRD